MISFKNIENYSEIYLGDVSIIEVYSGNHKVWPDKEEPLKFKRIQLDGTEYKLECDDNGTLTSGETIGDLSLADISGDTNPVTSITIGDCVTEIGGKTFSGWSKVTGELVIPNSVKTIGDNAFSSCYGFTSLTLHDSVREIGSNAFYECSGLTGSLNIPDSIRYINPYAFQWCTGLNGTLTIGTGITSIGNGAFGWCFNLTAVYCKATTPPSLGFGVFASYDKPIYVPCDSVDAYKSATRWDELADRIVGWDFENDSECSEPKNIAFSLTEQGGRKYTVECNELSNGTLTQSNVGSNRVASDIYIGNCVTSIGGWSFSYHTLFRGTLTLPTGLTSIGDGAFQGCEGFDGTLTLPSSITEIGVFAFSNCTGLTAVYCKAITPPTLGFGVFDYTNNCPIYVPCESVDAYKSATNWSTYADRIQGWDFEKDSECPEPEKIAFSLTEENGSKYTVGCSDIVNVTLTSSNVGDIRSASDIYIGDCVKLIDNRAFSGQSGFTGDLVIPDSVREIGYNAFTDCYGFTSLTLPTGLTSINFSAFYHCSGFTGTLTIPNGVTTIGDNAFSNCYGFTGNLTLPTGITTIGDYTFQSCSGFTGTLTIPNGVTNIGSSAFNRCSGFVGDLVIPDNVREIGLAAFQYCSSLNGTLTIGTGVTSIGSGAFFRCSNLTAIYCKATTPPTLGNNNVFDYTNNSTIYVPCESVNAYKTANNWSTYADRIVGWDFEKNSECSESKNIAFSLTEQDGTKYIVECNELSNGTLTQSNVGSDKRSASDIYIGDCVTTIGDMAFYGCSGFTGDLVIPDSVTTIGQRAFTNCSGFTGTLTLPTGLTSIEMYVFRYCYGFTGDLVIPDKVTSIGTYAFQNLSSLTGTLTLPTGLTSINNQAFRGCENLTAIYCKAVTPPTLETDVFRETNDCPIYVPNASVDAYKSASGWSNYSNRITGYTF